MFSTRDDKDPDQRSINDGMNICDIVKVGSGGCGVPTGQKLMQAMTMPLEYLILNGVECEPYISCDDLLMREQLATISPRPEDRDNFIYKYKKS